MYTILYLHFGKRNFFDTKYHVTFEEEEITTLKEVHLFNYTFGKSDLGKIFYPIHYGGNDGNFGICQIVIKGNNEEDKQKAKETLKQEAMRILQKRIDEDTKVYQLIENEK